MENKFRSFFKRNPKRKWNNQVMSFCVYSLPFPRCARIKIRSITETYTHTHITHTITTTKKDKAKRNNFHNNNKNIQKTKQINLSLSKSTEISLCSPLKEIKEMN